MTSTIQNESTTTTCPWWCSAALNHLRWDCEAPWPQTGEVRWHGQEISKHVGVWGTEHRATEHGPTTIDAPVMDIHDVEGVTFTAAQARQHAADVLTAADLLDRVVAGR